MPLTKRSEAMVDFLFEQFPSTPPGTGSQPKNAVVMTQTWVYDDSLSYIPPSIRNRIPEYMKTDGRLHLAIGTEGFVYEISPDGQWGIVLFIVKCAIIHGKHQTNHRGLCLSNISCPVFVPLNHVTIGAEFLPLSQKMTGLFQATPMVTTSGSRHISSIPMFQYVNNNARKLVQYRYPVQLIAEDEGALKSIIRLTNDCMEEKRILLIIPEKDVASFEILDRGFLTFEIMDNGQPHASPWIRCPSAGPFQNFIQASSLGIRYEWYSSRLNAWFTTTIHIHTMERFMHQAVQQNSMDIALTVWRNAMHLIQALKGIVYSDHQSSQGFDRRLTFASSHVMQLEVKHLEQKCQWVQRLEISRPCPKRATVQDNFSLMKQQLSPLLTSISNPDIKRLNPGQKVYLPGSKCDLCIFSSAGAIILCVLDQSSPNQKICVLCSLLNRPCTFTRGPELRRLWGMSEPPLHAVGSLALYPTGTHRFLAFHLIRNQGVLQIPAPREIALGLFYRPPQDTDLNLDAEVDDLGVDING